ncbi:LysM peptidoglycan-binding domain-containing protein [Citrobacter sp. wls619]|uniref:LysM peptidoglycan-binding domain-containing protein n=1 Tax=Citrobacter sp. wls619 TaxID=2576432 RepID=UPI0010CA1CF8|nr:LysM peptidoglycan-binding domain-containing protein [Citrobacter sp. wls619]TKV05699.1 LysM peptidoglycan-binding domain-containing protein [Citrobacter sp. wls619]
MSHNFISATYNTIKKRAMYKMADGTVYVREGGTIPWRTQNPCNVRPNGRMESQYLQPLRLAVADTASGKFGMYGSEEDGWETEKKLLRSDLYRNCTISEMAEIHTPEKDGNDPVKYARDILAESGVSPLLTFGNMDDATLEKVMKAIKKKEGYYNLKETRIEKWIYTTNITVTDGVRPAADASLKVITGACERDCKTDKYGRLDPIVHKTEGMNIEVKAANLEGEYETIYSAQAGKESKNIILKRYLVQYKAHTLAYNPEPPHEKSQPEPIEYIVQSGDNLSRIAARYEVSVSELVENNGIKDPNKIYPGQKIVIYGKKEPDNVDSGGQSPQGGNGESYPVPPNDPTADTGNTTGNPVDGPLSTGGWTPDTTDGAGSSPVDTGGAIPSGTGESYPVPPNDPTAGAGNAGHPVDGPLSPGGWTPNTTDGADSSPAETGGAVPSGTGKSYPLPPYPDLPSDPTAGAGNTDHTSDGAGGQKSGSPQTTTTADKPTNLPTVGGKDSGNPQAHVRLSQYEAPWMVTAIDEAKKYKGADENIIDDSENFHILVGASFPDKDDMDGTESAWCGSFINYCLQVNDFAMWREPQRSQAISSKINKDRFVEIKEPVYGCMTMLPHHITLMYGLDKDKPGGFIGLGGNQGGVGDTKPGKKRVFGGTIKFSSFSLSKARFFLPKKYDKEKSGTVLGKYNDDELNEYFGINVAGQGNGTR